MQDHVIHKGDTGTPLVVVLGDLDGPVSLTGATVVFRYAVNGSAIEKTLTTDADQTANTGKAAAFWGATELNAVAAGNYPCQVKVTFANGKVRYFPSRRYGGLGVRDPL